MMPRSENAAPPYRRRLRSSLDFDDLHSLRRGELERAGQGGFAPHTLLQLQLDLDLLRGRGEAQPARHLLAAAVVEIVERNLPVQIVAAKSSDVLDAEIRTDGDLLPDLAAFERQHRPLARAVRLDRARAGQRGHGAQDQRDQLLVAQRLREEPREVLGRGQPPVEHVAAQVQQRGGVAERVQRGDAQRGGPAHRDLDLVPPAVLRSVHRRLAGRGERLRLGVRLLDLLQQRDRIERRTGRSRSVAARNAEREERRSDPKPQAASRKPELHDPNGGGVPPPPSCESAAVRARSSSDLSPVSASLVLRSRSLSTCTKLHRSFTASSESRRISLSRLSRSMETALVSSTAVTVADRGAWSTRPISPKCPPALRLAIAISPLVTCTLPRKSTNSSSPVSPSRMTVCPFWNCRPRAMPRIPSSSL